MLDAQDLEDKALQAWGVARSENNLDAMLRVLHFLQELRLTHTPAPIEYQAPKHLGVGPEPQDLPPDSPVLHTQLQERDAQVPAAPSPTREAACGSAQYYGHFPPYAETV